MIEFHPVLLDSDTADHQGMLAYRGSKLVAVLVQLSTIHLDLSGCWYVEALFAQAEVSGDRIFADLDSVRRWLEELLCL